MSSSKSASMAAARMVSGVLRDQASDLSASRVESRSDWPVLARFQSSVTARARWAMGALSFARTAAGSDSTVGRGLLGVQAVRARRAIAAQVVAAAAAVVMLRRIRRGGGGCWVC